MEKLFDDWAQQVVLMRFIQEYETIKGLLVLSELVKTMGYDTVEAAMVQVKDEFGQKTVNIALDVTLKVGMRREKLQSVMLTDHFINMTMEERNTRRQNGVPQLPHPWRPPLCPRKIWHQPQSIHTLL